MTSPFVNESQTLCSKLMKKLFEDVPSKEVILPVGVEDLNVRVGKHDGIFYVDTMPTNNHPHVISSVMKSPMDVCDCIQKWKERRTEQDHSTQ